MRAYETKSSEIRLMSDHASFEGDVYTASSQRFSVLSCPEYPELWQRHETHVDSKEYSRHTGLFINLRLILADDLNESLYDVLNNILMISNNNLP